MINFGQVQFLDGSILITELEQNGVTIIPNQVGSKNPIIDGNGDLWLRINETDRTKAQAVLDSYLN